MANNRKELEAALAAAEAECRRANEGFQKAQADRAKAEVDWRNEVTDRLKADLDRCKLGKVWDNRFPDRRKADVDLDALFKAVADRHKTYLAMSDTEAEWNKTEASIRRAELEWGKAEANLDTAIVKRDEIVAALDELKGSAPKASSSEPIGAPIKRLWDAIRRANNLSTYSTKLGEPAVRDENKRSREASGQRRTIPRPNANFRMQDRNFKRALTSSPLLRQTIELLTLILAYLQYCFLDVQLEIMTPPSVTTWPLH